MVASADPKYALLSLRTLARRPTLRLDSLRENQPINRWSVGIATRVATFFVTALAQKSYGASTVRKRAEPLPDAVAVRKTPDGLRVPEVT